MNPLSWSPHAQLVASCAPVATVMVWWCRDVIRAWPGQPGRGGQ